MDFASNLAVNLKNCERMVKQLTADSDEANLIRNKIFERREKVGEEMKQFFENLINKVVEIRTYYENRLDTWLDEKSLELSQMVAARDQRRVSVRRMKSDLEDLQFKMTSKGTAANVEVAKLCIIENELQRIQAENQRTLLTDDVNLNIGYLPTTEMLVHALEPNKLIYLKACDIEPTDIVIEVGSGVIRTNETNIITVKFPRFHSKLHLYVRVQVAKENSNVSTELSLEPNSNRNRILSYVFSPQETGVYFVSAFLYDVPIKNSPLKLAVVCGQQFETPAVLSVTNQVENLLNISTTTNNYTVGRGIPLASTSFPKEPSSTMGRGMMGLGRCRLNFSVNEANIVSAESSNATNGQCTVDELHDMFSDSKNEMHQSNSGRLKPLSAFALEFKPSLLATNQNENAQACSNDDKFIGRVFRTAARLSNEEDWDSVSPTAGANYNNNNISSKVAGDTFDFDDDSASPHGKVNPRIRPDLTPFLRQGPNALRARWKLNLGMPQKSEPAQVYFRMPIGCTSTRLNEYIVCDTRHNVIKVFKSDGSAKVMTEESNKSKVRLSFPSAVVMVEDDNFVVKDDSALYKFNYNCELINMFGFGVFRKLFGLCVDEVRGHVLTLDLGPNNLCSIDPVIGKIINKTPFQPSFSAHSKCYYMDSVNDRLVVSDYGLHKVHVCNTEGDLQFSFGGDRGRARGLFSGPSGVALDANGNMLIGDSGNHRVQVWSAAGAYLGDVQFSQRVSRMSNIHLTADGDLMVMNYNEHYVSIFSLE